MCNERTYGTYSLTVIINIAVSNKVVSYRTYEYGHKKLVYIAG